VLAAIFASSFIIYDRLVAIEEAKEWRVHTTDVLDTLDVARQGILKQESSLRGYLLAGNDSFLQSYHESQSGFAGAIRKLGDLTSDNPSQQSRLDELNDLAEKWRSSVAGPAIELMASPEGREAAPAVENSAAGRTAMELVHAKISEIDGVERRLLATRDEAQKNAFAAAYIMTVLGGTASLVIAMLVAALLSRNIALPITRLTTAVTTLAKGDTTVELPSTGRRDEVAKMAAAVQVLKESLIERERLQLELAHANRVMTMGQLTASIAHEVNQPIAAIVTNAQAALRWLGRQPPDLGEVRESLDYIVRDGNRAGDVITRIRALIKKAPARKDSLDINEAVREVIVLTRGEAAKNGVSLQTQFASGLPPVQGDRVQLQQVLLNLIVNAIEAMSGVSEGARKLQISTGEPESGGVVVAVCDSGPGLEPEAGRLFEPFHTTKSEGMGMGLSICQSIIEAHGGQVWASVNKPRGAVFQFTLPLKQYETGPA
jgi:C4-dicarboxylate-specific signal transduction histidine kinase